ncbi:hypothetical protein Rhe02_09910 [Rhizocola hellebori]|uniref:N-acetylmuramoyl-L-alanine amidase n=1 Tax=Rhizocola hellebori TaxID=1392758 RepID=A0A8J3Q392_9ACTN|nr:hypothetical protein Rhe02_09910 [Rhizocola hellebori]
MLLLAILLAVLTASAPPPPTPRESPESIAARGAGKPARADGLNCPSTLDCVWLPAVFGPVLGRPGEYKYAPANRPAQPRIKYIVIHGTESSYESTIATAQNPSEPNSWHYSIRSGDGRVAQHLGLKDIGWHTGNHFISWHSIGIEHEGYAGEPGFYTEAMYRASATLVRHLARQFGIPLDRQHILGHDNVPGMTPQWVRRMHTDPGPFWDWAHYFELLDAPLRAEAGNLITIAPDYATTQPAFTGCTAPTRVCPKHGSSAVLLRSLPQADAPLVNDLVLDPDGGASTMNISDQGAHATAGQRYVVAEVRGDWTAIWYLGRKAWFANPASSPNALPGSGRVARPKTGRATIPVYGWPLPDLPVVLPYLLQAGQGYAVSAIIDGFEFIMTTDASGARTGGWTVRAGGASYAQIQFGHRVMFVSLDDVDVT